MNMPLSIQRAYPEVEKRSQGPQSVVGRLREWSRARHYPSMNCWPPESPMYAVLKSPGRATNGSQDGGMASTMDRMGGAVAAYTRSKEVGAAVAILPSTLRIVVLTMYHVEKMESPRPERIVAEMLKVPKSQVQARLNRAYGWLARELCIPEV
jgi:hypothetical protein